MSRLATLFALVAVGALVWTGSSLGTTRPVSSGKPCVPNKFIGTAKYGSTVVTVYCGSGKATLHFQGKTYKFTNGLCGKIPGAFFLGLGKLTVKGPVKFKALYLTAPAIADGTYRDATIRFQLPPTDRFSYRNTIVLAGKFTRGTFSGRVTTGAGRTVKLGPHFSGSFTCPR